MSTKKSTHRSISTGSEDPAWLKLLESSSKGTFTEQHRSFEQLRELRRMAKLPAGVKSTYAWVRQLKAQNRIRADRGFGINNVATIKYIFI